MQDLILQGLQEEEGKYQFDFKEEGKERSKCPKFSSDEQCIHDTFNYIHEEIIALKHDFEKLLYYLDDE